jgi:hypothetical protein
MTVLFLGCPQPRVRVSVVVHFVSHPYVTLGACERWKLECALTRTSLTPLPPTGNMQFGADLHRPG